MFSDADIERAFEKAERQVDELLGAAAMARAVA